MPAATPALDASCFTLPLLSPGALDGAIPSNDPYETNFIDHGQRNIFRQPWQRRADISLVKMTQITERASLKYSFDVYNLTNTASFDIPINDVTQNPASTAFRQPARRRRRAVQQRLSVNSSVRLPEPSAAWV